MLNRVILMGRLVSDPELKTTNTGLSVTSFRIAVDRSYVKSGEERKADFFDIVCWRNSAEFVCRYFSKGSMIAIDGQLQSRTYQAKDGTNRYVVEVVASSVSFTGEHRNDDKKQQPANNGNRQPEQPYNNYQQSATPSGYANEPSYQQGGDFEGYSLDDDLPF